MILTACKRGDKIILPRNVHRSAINAMILCGAVPVYINPQMDKQLGISLGMSVEDVKKRYGKIPMQRPFWSIIRRITAYAPI